MQPLCGVFQKKDDVEDFFVVTCGNFWAEWDKSLFYL
jgi:hypothetical protein